MPAARIQRGLASMRGGRSGVTAVGVGLLFLLSLLAVPVLGAAIPRRHCVAPMEARVSEIKWLEQAVALPAFLTILIIPLTYSIANGLAFGFITFVLLKAATGHQREVHWLMYVLTSCLLRDSFT